MRRAAPRGLVRAPLAACAACAALALACAGAPDPEPGSAPDEVPAIGTLQQAGAEIDRAIGEARAASVAQCRLTPLGERPCGGPRLYRAYSVAETDSAQLAVLVAIYDRMDRERNAQQGLVSTCEYLMAPGLGLEGGRCVTR